MAKDIFKDAIAKGYQRIFSRRFSHSYALQEPTLGSPIEDVGQNNKFRFLFKGEGVALDSSNPNVVEEGNFALFMQEECLTAKKTAAGSEVIAESCLNSRFSQTSNTEHQGESYGCRVRVESNARFATLGHDMAVQRSGLSCTTYLSQAATSKAGSSFDKDLAIMNTEQFLLSLAVASQFHDKVIRSSIPTFGILDISHSLHVLNLLKSQFSDAYAKELPALCEETSALCQDLPVLGDPLPALCDQLPALRDQPLGLEDPRETFLDDDDIKIGKVVKDISGKIEERVLQSDFRILIPKSIIRSMPPAPNDIETSQPGQEFCIQIRKVALDQVDLVNSCLNWLLKDRPGTTTFLGLACKYADDRSPSLVQLSFHERCLLISLPGRNLLIPGKYPTMLKTVLSENNILKIGADVHKDALALFHFLGLVTNSCIKITHLSTGQRRKKGVSVMFRDLFNWTWMERKKVVNSDWGSVLTLEQVKLAVLEAWSSRSVWIRQSEVWKGEAPYFSLKNMPFELLNYFGRSLFSPGEVSRKDRDTSVEMTGAKIEVHKGFLKLQQTHFRSRVLGLNSTVELQFKNGREPEKYLTMVRRGNKVVLDPDRSETPPDNRKLQEIDIDVDMISKVLVDNSDNDDVQMRKLQDVLYFLLCSPPACPPHILVALGCSIESVGVRPKVYELDIPELDNCKMGLNSSQLVAWQHMLTNPMAAVIGPPGTGKTSLIKGVAKAWEHLGNTGEVLLCVAHQNVAVRHMAESMLKEGISGVLLLISEDYYVDWHEEQYTQVKDAIVVSGSQTASGMKTWAFRNKVTVPKVILCTLAVIGSQSFYTSLMGTKVTFMIIDECSQAAEGHLISNLVCLPHLQMLSVLGDPSQLPPYGKPLQSVFDLVAGKCDIKFLHQQYRMPHCISNFVSDEFYQGKLETLTRPEHLHLKPIPKPLMWIHVSGFPKYAAGTKKSLCNEAEAEAIMKYCKEYKRKADEAGVVLTLGKLIVLTLYEGQRTLISRLLKENDLQIVPVYNVDSFQGQEADAVLISLVVGDRGSSFAVDRNRACVLLSRAKRLMHVFGNLDSVKASKNSSFSTARVDTIWRSLASYCETNDWVASEEDLQSVVESSFVTD